MLSSLLEIMNRERALSFSAALCLLTVTAAALPGLFQEEDPFENASLWESTHAIASSSLPKFAKELSVTPQPVSSDSSESFVSVESELPLDSSDAIGKIPELELSSEPVLDSDEMIESLDDHPSPNAETSELELDDPGILEVSLESPTLEPELIETDSEALAFSGINGETGDSYITEPEVDFDPTAVAQQETEIEADTQLDLALESAKNENIELSEEVGQPPVSRDPNEDALRDPLESGGQTEIASQGENVYQGEFWEAPPTPEALPSTSQAPLLLSSAQANLELQTTPQAQPLELKSLPPQTYPEYDWSQSPYPSNTSTEILESAGPQATQQELDQSAELIGPLVSPQELSSGYRQFAAGNPALGGSAEFNPMRSYSTPQPQTWQQYSDMVLNIPQEISVDQSLHADSLEQPLIADFEPSQFVDIYQAETYGAYQPVCCPTQQQPARQTLQTNNSDNPAFTPPRPHPKASHPLLYCLNRGWARMKLRSFKLNPFRKANVCPDCGQSHVSHGLFKNWFKKGPNYRRSSQLGSRLNSHNGGSNNWLLSPPAHRSVGNLANGLGQPPAHTPFRSLGKWLM